MDPSVPTLPAFLERPRRPDEPTSERVLQVHLLWGEVLLDTRSVQPGAGLTIGDRLGWRWRMLGVDLGPAPGPLRRVLPWVAPGWSEVTPESAADLSVPGLEAHTGGEDLRTLVEVADEGWVLRIAPGWLCEVERDGRIWPLEALVQAGSASRDGSETRLPILPDQRITVRFGDLTLAVWTAPREGPAPRPGWLPEPALLAAMSVTASAAALLALLVATSQGTAETSVEEISEQLVEIALHTPPPPPPEPLVLDPAGGGSAPADDAPDLPDDPTPEQQEAYDEAVAMSSGVVAALEAGAFGGLFDDAALSSSLTAAAGGLLAAKGGGGPGALGLHGRGGLTGGGTAVGSGWCEPGTDCRLGGRRNGYGPGTGDGKREGDLGSMETGDPITLGALSRDQVDEVVKNHLSAIRYCYQRQLQRDPTLAGKVVVKFTIAGDGSVSDARIRSSTLGSGDAESCIVGRFHRMTFPEPAGRGLVVVSYPFLFQGS